MTFMLTDFHSPLTYEGVVLNEISRKRLESCSQRIPLIFVPIFIAYLAGDTVLR